MNEWSEENRRARYRAWDKTRKIMRHVITRIDWLVDGRPIRVYWCTSEIEDGIIHDFDFILFQSTGLHDSTRTEEFPEGKEIFEGDIVHITDGGDCFFHADWDEEYEPSGTPSDDICDRKWFDKAKQGCVFIVRWDQEMAGFWIYQNNKAYQELDWNVWTGPVTITVIGNTVENPVKEVEKWV